MNSTSAPIFDPVRLQLTTFVLASSSSNLLVRLPRTYIARIVHEQDTAKTRQSKQKKPNKRLLSLFAPERRSSKIKSGHLAVSTQNSWVSLTFNAAALLQTSRGKARRAKKASTLAPCVRGGSVDLSSGHCVRAPPIPKTAEFTPINRTQSAHCSPSPPLPRTQPVIRILRPGWSTHYEAIRLRETRWATVSKRVGLAARRCNLLSSTPGHCRLPLPCPWPSTNS